SQRGSCLGRGGPAVGTLTIGRRWLLSCQRFVLLRLEIHHPSARDCPTLGRGFFKKATAK
ncbi:MAG: hypothetical protein RR304_07775, partial [Bacteroides sp.]